MAKIPNPINMTMTHQSFDDACEELEQMLAEPKYAFAEYILRQILDHLETKKYLSKTQIQAIVNIKASTTRSTKSSRRYEGYDPGRHK